MTDTSQTPPGIAVRFQLEGDQQVQLRTVALGITDDVAVIALDEDADGDLRFTITAGPPCDSIESIVQMLEGVAAAARAAYDQHIAAGGE